MVMLGLAFSKMATSASHSLCCTGCCAAGGAQSMLIVTLPPEPAPALPEPELLEAELLEQAAAARTRPATATATTGRWRSWSYMLLIAPSLPWAEHGRWACPHRRRCSRVGRRRR